MPLLQMRPRVIIRDAVRDGSWRYRLTYAQEMFSRAVRWLRAERLHFLTREEIVRPLRGFRSRGRAAVWEDAVQQLPVRFQAPDGRFRMHKNEVSRALIHLVRPRGLTQGRAEESRGPRA